MVQPITNSGSAGSKARVTQSDVARVAGVHNTTVSLSLRNCPSIPEATRKRIRAIADELGYYPDPTLQALVAYRKGRVTDRPKETLAYITNWDSRWGWRTVSAHEQIYLGAQRKAAELGYQLEHFWLGEPDLSQARLSNILYHRGITGVLIAAHQTGFAPLNELDWSRLCAVQIGSFPQAPALHRVIDDHGGMVRRALQRILAAGFERVGLVVAQGWDDSVDQAWSTGYLTEQSRLPIGHRIPALRFSGSGPDRATGATAADGASELSALAQWLRAYRPEVIVGFSPVVHRLIGQLGIAVPREVAYVDLDLEPADEGIAGMRQNSAVSGEVATALLVGQIQQNLCGLPIVPTTTLVDGTWMEGASLPAKPASTRAGAKLKVHAEADDTVWLATA